VHHLIYFVYCIVSCFSRDLHSLILLFDCGNIMSSNFGIFSPPGSDGSDDDAQESTPIVVDSDDEPIVSSKVLRRQIAQSSAVSNIERHLQRMGNLEASDDEHSGDVGGRGSREERPFQRRRLTSPTLRRPVSPVHAPPEQSVSAMIAKYGSIRANTFRWGGEDSVFPISMFEHLSPSKLSTFQIKYLNRNVLINFLTLEREVSIADVAMVLESQRSNVLEKMFGPPAPNFSLYEWDHFLGFRPMVQPYDGDQLFVSFRVERMKTNVQRTVFEQTLNQDPLGRDFMICDGVYAALQKIKNEVATAEGEFYCEYVF
jgi:hypothetical protein